MVEVFKNTANISENEQYGAFSQIRSHTCIMGSHNFKGNIQLRTLEILCIIGISQEDNYLY